MKAKIALYAFGATPVFFRHLIDFARAESIPFDWCLILTSPVHRKLMQVALPDEAILDIYRELPREPVGGDLSLLANYPGSLVEDLEAEKWKWNRRMGRKRLARGIDLYRLIKDFLVRTKATHLLCSMIESPDGKIAVAAAQELGIEVIVPNDCRTLTGYYFSKDVVEGLPDYAEATSETTLRAKEIIREFRASWAPAHAVARDYEPVGNDDELLNPYLPSFVQRAIGMARNLIERPDLFDPEHVRISVLNNLPGFRDALWAVRTRYAEREFDIEEPEQLPKRFVFYPLHLTPEASINVPAPYYVDQFRVIDELRFAMPADCALVVKEHRAGIMSRPMRFMKRLRTIPGVLVAKYTMPARALIERASLTATVTGTAAFEAFLLGKPALALGAGLSAWALGRQAERNSLRQEIKNSLDKSIPDDVIINKVAQLLSVRYPFYFASPYYKGEPMLRRGNVIRTLRALIDHLERSHRRRSITLASSRTAFPC